jgi:hypothetical protein
MHSRLKWSFYFLRIGNLFWIIFSIIMCENTLNYNYIEEVLGSNGRIFFPSQLLPMVISLCSLLRILYICFERWRSPEDIKPSLANTPYAPTRAATVPRGKGWLKIFSSRTHADGTHQEAKEIFEDSDLDPDLVDQPAWWRYLVAWLPWLQAASHWFKEEKPEHAESAVAAQRQKRDDLESGYSDKADFRPRRQL